MRYDPRIHDYRCEAVMATDLTSLHSDLVKIIYERLDVCGMFCFQFTCKKFRSKFARIFGYTAVDGAAINGHINLLKWLCVMAGKTTVSRNTFIRVVRKGHLSMLQFLRSPGPEMRPFEWSYTWSFTPCEAASYKGRLEVLQWLRSGPDPCPWYDTRECIVYAAEKGHLDVLEWIRTFDKEWPSELVGRVIAGKMSTSQKIHVLQHVRSHSPPAPWSDACYWAVLRGEFDIIKWLRSPEHEGGPCPWGKGVCTRAARCGDLETLKWLRSAEHTEGPCPWDENTCYFAAVNGHIDSLRWLRSQNPPCPWTAATRLKAEEMGYYGG